jgi:tRNA (guanine37-N1)-methyltransferase
LFSTPQLPPRKRIAHFVMNLPDSAITFLDAFRGILAPSSSSSEADIDLAATYDVMPMVHCHCFTRELEPEAAERDIRHVRSFVRFPHLLRVLMVHLAAR